MSIRRLSFFLLCSHHRSPFQSISVQTFDFSCNCWARGPQPRIRSRVGPRGKRAIDKIRIKDEDGLRDRLWDWVTFPHSKPGNDRNRGRLAQELLAREPESPRKQVDLCVPAGGFNSEGRDGHSWGNNHYVLEKIVTNQIRAEHQTWPQGAFEKLHARSALSVPCRPTVPSFPFPFIFLYSPNPHRGGSKARKNCG